MSKIRVSLVQFDTKSGYPDINIKRSEEFIQEAKEAGSSLVCFPEMWTCGFDWTYITSQKVIHNKTIDILRDLSSKYKIWLNGSLPYVDEHGNVFNTSILFSPEGSIKSSYSKIHLFKIIEEHKYLSAGNSISILDTPWGKTGFAVCYDIRFPELFRLYALNGVEVVIVCAAFPKSRINHWRTLATARAIENQMYIIAVNRVGYEINTNGGLTEFGGNSMIVDPWGDVITETDNKTETVLNAEIDRQFLIETREKIPVISDRRDDIYKIVWT